MGNAVQTQLFSLLAEHKLLIHKIWDYFFFKKTILIRELASKIVRNYFEMLNHGQHLNSGAYLIPPLYFEVFLKCSVE